MMKFILIFALFPFASQAAILNPTGMDITTGLFKIAGPLDTFMVGVTSLVSTLFKATAIVTIANTTTETSTIGAGVGTTTITANTLAVGNTIRIHGGGVYSAAAIAPGNLTIKVKNGTNVLASVVLGSILSAASNLGFDFDVDLICQSTGASGSFAIAGKVGYTSSTLGARLFGDLNNSGTLVTIDTTSNQTLNVTATWQTASASNTITVLESLVTLQL